jgi:hypothetical protein
MSGSITMSIHALEVRVSEKEVTIFVSVCTSTKILCIVAYIYFTVSE